MALVLADRVKETTTTTGTGTYTLAGAADSSFETFASIGNGNTTYYACTDGSDFEVGIGTYTASGTTLARTTILQSSNSDNAVNWGAGTKDIFCTQPAEKAVFRDASGHIIALDGRNLTNVDAATLDSIDSGSFLRSDAADSFSGKIDATGTIEFAGGTTFDPSGGGSGTDTATDVGIALKSGVRLVGTHSGYIRTLLEWNSSSALQIGRDNTSLIAHTKIYGGNNGVELYEGSSKKFETTSTGATVTGTLVATSLDISGDVDVDGTLEADAMTLNGTAITSTATLSTGISNNNVPKFTSGVADNDFLKVAGTAIEGRSASEVLSDIGGITASSTDTLTNKTLTTPVINGFSGTGDGSLTGNLSITNTSNNGPTLSLISDDPSDAGDFNTEGHIKFFAENDASQSVEYANIEMVTRDISDGSEDGRLEININEGGTVTRSFIFDHDRFYITNAQQIHWLDWSSTNDYILRPTTTISGDRTVTLPDASGEVLLTDGDGSSLTNVNATTLDSVDSTSFLRSDAADTKTSGNLTFSDDVKAVFGTGSDLEIFHDGSNSRIKDVGTGSLIVTATNLKFSKADGTEDYINCVVDDTVELFFNGNKKIETSNTGATVTGTLVADGLDIARDTDASAEIGRAHIGSVGFTDFSGFSHVDQNATGSYALLQSSSGNTYLNAASGQTVHYRINNSDVMTMNNTGLAVTGDLTLQSTDAGATENPTLDLYRNSASPADNDILGHIHFSGENDADQKVIYGEIEMRALDVSDGTEDGRLVINSILNGTTTTHYATGFGFNQFFKDVLLAQNINIQFEGATNDAVRTTLTVADPSSNRTVTLPDASGTVQLTDGSGASLTSLNASQLTSGTVPNARLDAQLQDVAGLAVTNGGFIVGDGSNFVLETGDTVRTSLGLGTAAVLNTGISNTNVPKFTSGVADDDFLRVAGTSIEGRSASEVLSDIGGQAALTFGISNTNAVKIDSTSVADNEFARFTANGLESRSASEVLSDIGAITASSTDTLTNKTIDASQLSGTVANARLDQQLQDVAGLAVTNGNFIVGDGSNFVAESGSTARDSLSLGTSSDVQFDSFGVGTAASGTTGEIRATADITSNYSDERLKNIHGTIPNALDKVKSLGGYYFTENEIAKSLGYDNDAQQVGVIAQEVEKVLPEAVKPAPIDDKYLTVQYEKMVPLLIEAMKEQQAKIEELESRLAKLEA